MWEACIALINSLAGHPYVILTVIGIGVLGMSIRLVLSNPAFWEVVKTHYTTNTALVKENLENTRLILVAQQALGIRIGMMEGTVATREAQMKIDEKVDMVDSRLSRLESETETRFKAIEEKLELKACDNSQLCPNRKQV